MLCEEKELLKDHIWLWWLILSALFILGIVKENELQPTRAAGPFWISWKLVVGSNFQLPENEDNKEGKLYDGFVFSFFLFYEVDKSTRQGLSSAKLH